MALDEGNFGDYSGIIEGTAAGDIDETTLLAAIVNLKALIPEPEVDSGEVAPHPDFMRIPAETAALLRAEITALSAAIVAAA